MIRRILAGLDGSECSRSAGQFAADLAAKINAEVEALSVVDIRPLEGPMIRDFTAHLGLEPYETYTHAFRKTLLSRAEDTLAQFRQDAEKIGMTQENISTATEIGVVPETICRRAKEADLVVMGQHGESLGFTGGFLGSNSEQVVRRSPRPVMVCPAEFEPIQRPLIAYDGTGHADNALHLACDFAFQFNNRLTVLVVNDGNQIDEAAAGEVAKQADRYLKHSKIEYDINTVSGRPEKRILEHTEENGHGMIVMGAFGHSRVRELIIGSTTVQVMRNSSVPVMLIRK